MKCIKEGVTPLIAARSQQLELAVLNSAPHYARSTAVAKLETPRPSSPVSLETYREMVSLTSLNEDIQSQLDEDIARLAAAQLQCVHFPLYFVF